MGVNTTRILIVLAIGGGGVYAFFMGGVVYVIAFIIALLAWTLREAVWWRGSGHRGGFMKSIWGLTATGSSKNKKRYREAELVIGRGARGNLRELRHAYDEGPGCETLALRWTQEEGEEWEYAAYKRGAGHEDVARV